MNEIIYLAGMFLLSAVGLGIAVTFVLWATRPRKKGKHEFVYIMNGRLIQCKKCNAVYDVWPPDPDEDEECKGVDPNDESR